MNSSGYDRLARCYRLLETLAFGRALERARFAHFDHLRDRRDILLLGDGDGRGLQHVCRIAPHAHITSVDSSAGMLARAAARLSPADRERVTFHHADALNLPLPAGRHDAIVTLFFLDCFDAAQVRELVACLRPALTPDGVWLFADFNLPDHGWSRLRALVWLALMFAFFRWQTGLATRALPPSETILQKSGLEPVARQTWQGDFLRSIVYRPVAML